MITYIPDEIAFKLVKLGKNPKEYAMAALLEKLERDGINVSERKK